MNFKAFLWFILCALRRKLLRAGGSETDGSTSLQPLSALNQRHYWQKHLETLRNWFADPTPADMHTFESRMLLKHWLDMMMSGERGQGREKQEPRKVTALLPYTVWRFEFWSCVTHLLTTHQVTFCSKNLANLDQFPRGFSSPITYHSFREQILV